MTEFCSLEEAIARNVRDGDTVAMEGFTHLIPYAAGHEVIRQQRKHLTLIRMTPDLIYDQLIGMGAADRLVFSWGGNPGVGSLHRLRDAVENGWPQPLALEEHSHAAMANAYEAGAANLPFAVFRGYKGVDLPKVNPKIRTHRLPVHRREAGGGSGDSSGRDDHSRAARGSRRQCAAGGHRRRAEAGRAGRQARGRDGRGAGRGSRRTRPQRGDSAGVDYLGIAVVPGGAYPSYAQGYYRRANGFYIAWDDISRDRDQVPGLDAR